jgi:hypothetical protein
MHRQIGLEVCYGENLVGCWNSPLCQQLGQVDVNTLMKGWCRSMMRNWGIRALEWGGRGILTRVSIWDGKLGLLYRALVFSAAVWVSNMVGFETRGLLIVFAWKSVPLRGTSKLSFCCSESEVSECIWTRECPGHRFFSQEEWSKDALLHSVGKRVRGSMDWMSTESSNLKGYTSIGIWSLMNILDSGSLYSLAIFVNARCEFWVLQSVLPNCMSISNVCLKINECIQEYSMTKNERKD